MTQLEYRSPLPDDIVSVAARMRDGDVLEVAASGGYTPLSALTESIRSSSCSFVVVLNGRPEAIFGYTYDGGDAASVWFLGTSEVTKDKRLFMAESRRIIEAWTKCFPKMHNLVSEENVVSRRWLRKLGFVEGHTRKRYGTGVTPFIYFSMLGDV